MCIVEKREGIFLLLALSSVCLYDLPGKCYIRRGCELEPQQEQAGEQWAKDALFSKSSEVVVRWQSLFLGQD